VVAEEIGNLATMSGGAASEIKEIIERSISNVTGIIDDSKVKINLLINEGEKSIKESQVVRKRCEIIFETLVSNITIVKTKMDELNESSGEQHLGTQTIAGTIDNLNSSSSDLDASANGLKGRILTMNCTPKVGL
jgi:methyl-accepting chemotaxis protein